MDAVTLGIAKKYVDETAKGLGAVKGAPCTIKSITEGEDGSTIIFAWTGADGTEQTGTTFLPRGPKGDPGKKGDPGEPGKDGSGVDTEARAKIAAISNEIAFKPEDYGLPILHLKGDTSAMTKDTAVDLAYAYADKTGTASVKWQGSSSLSYPKKNYTIKFDNAFEAAEGWGEQTKYCFKANFIDHTHARNLCCAKLHGQSVKTREVASETLSSVYIVASPGISEETFAYTTASNVQNRVVYTRSTVSGGKLHVNFDSNKITNIHLWAALYDSEGNPYKVAGRPRDAIVAAPPETSLKYISGDQDMSIWDDVGSGEYFYIASAPVSFPIPDGCTVLLYQLISDTYTSSPDGSLTFAWSAEAEAAGTWVHKWAKNGGITATVKTGDAELAALPNGGAVDGFPCVIMLNDEFHGLYTWNIPKDGWMLGMGSGTNECILCANGVRGGGADSFKSLAEGFDGSHDFDLEYITDKNNTGWALTSLNRMLSAVINSDGSDLDTTVAQYLDWQSVIDHYIQTVLTGAADCTIKNYNLFTKGGVKWLISEYDMDSTFALWWNGKSFTLPDAKPTFASYAAMHRAMWLVYTYKKDALKARYAIQRAGTFSEANVTNLLTNYMAGIPSQVLDADAAKWPTIPSTSASNLAQMLNWYRLRCQIIDKEIEAL